MTNEKKNIEKQNKDREYRRRYYMENKEALKQYQKDYYRRKKTGVVKTINKKSCNSWKGEKNPVMTKTYGKFTIIFD